MLLDHGADPSLRDEAGDTALDCYRLFVAKLVEDGIVTKEREGELIASHEEMLGSE